MIFVEIFGKNVRHGFSWPTLKVFFAAEPWGYDDDKGDDHHHVHAFAAQFWIYFRRRSSKKKPRTKNHGPVQVSICADLPSIFLACFFSSTGGKHSFSTMGFYVFGCRGASSMHHLLCSKPWYETPVEKKNGWTPNDLWRFRGWLGIQKSWVMK